MLKVKVEIPDDLNPQETSEWLEALDEIVDQLGPDRASYVLERLMEHASAAGVHVPLRWNTPYVNTIPPEEQVAVPGDRAIERSIKSLVRWNAIAMVVRANKHDANIGGHLATYASLATLLEVGFNHFFRGSYDNGRAGDFIYFQGHASPGVYARAFLEGRLSEKHLENFRHELREHPGLSSYPHPWLMPDFWQFPTVSMGLGPITAIYQARFMKYLENRSVIPTTGRKVWAFLGDGECDEPESLGALTLASREKLDNLIFVVNCNLQRLDGPVRGNGSIIQELEAAFRGAGWNVIKVVWGTGWDDLLARDTTGLLLKRMHECVDGEYQVFRANNGAFIRKEFFGKYPELLKLVEHLSDEEIWNLRRGGHDPAKVYNAYKRACGTSGQPTVILAKTVKGYGMGEIAEGRNTAHQQKKLTDTDLMKIRDRFNVPVSDEACQHVDFYRPPDDSPELTYLKSRVQALGGSIPQRKTWPWTVESPALELFHDALGGSRGREASTTAAFVAVLKVLMKDPKLGKLVVPIIPDEARTFGMESLFREYGIYASQGQRYRPVDAGVLLYYKEAVDGQVLEEGITEAGSMASCFAAGTAYANYGVPMIPFYTYYSMFGYQRVGDLMWAFADSRGKGFIMGGTAGRSTLLGEGLQHQDGHSPLLMSVIPTCAVYDPAYAFELAVIIQDGIRRMYTEREDRFYYLTIYNENYVQPPMPEGDGVREAVRDGILRGIYKYRPAANGPAVAQLFGSGSILNEALKAQQILAERYQVATDVWSVTSYNELRRDALDAERWNRLHPSSEARTPYIVKALEGAPGPIIASSDYMKAVPDQLAPWLCGRLNSLGTDGFGRSENREHLRKFFEISAEAIVQATLSALARAGQFDGQRAEAAIAEMGFSADSADPVHR
ncbi:MAG TPA: pyruvate dehydrogenase (acetyl-transferring), homodimeric type [Bryobacteraceae bacterium]|jgi:pyruvate dehydrogenase E1 component|nr:pyruvate dehydrogenase (acetyl-transferring), homodimeric type [Bryobacteraceae bacterium]